MLYIYMYVYMYIYIYICVYIYVYICIYISARGFLALRFAPWCFRVMLYWPHGQKQPILLGVWFLVWVLVWIYKVLVSKIMGLAFFLFPVIDMYHIFGLKHVILTVWPKKVNEARGLIFGLDTYIYVISIHAKYHRSNLSRFLMINTCHVFCQKCVFLTIRPKNRLWALNIFWIDSCGSYQYLCKKSASFFIPFICNRP